MDGLKSAGKSFEISKWEVWEAYRQVKANKGGPGVDKVTLEDLTRQIYREICTGSGIGCRRVVTSRPR